MNTKPPKNKLWKNSIGHWLTKAIFFEQDDGEKNYARYTLKDEDHISKGILYPSLKNIFLASFFVDPTEFSFAKQALGGWQHWKAIKSQGWFKDYYGEWLEEAEVMVQSIHLENLLKEAADPKNKNYYNASKYLLEKGWIPKEKSKTGPRTQKQIAQETKKQLEENKVIREDFDRLNLEEGKLLN